MPKFGTTLFLEELILSLVRTSFEELNDQAIYSGYGYWEMSELFT